MRTSSSLLAAHPLTHPPTHSYRRNKTEGVWCQDFPFLEDGQPDDDSEFGRDLRAYFTKLNGFFHDTGDNSTAGQGRGHPRLVEAIQVDLPRVDFRAAQVCTSV